MKKKMIIAVLFVFVVLVGVAFADQSRGTCSTASVRITSGHIKLLADGGGWSVGACGTVKDVDGGEVERGSGCVECGDVQDLSQLDGGCHAALVQSLCP